MRISVLTHGLARGMCVDGCHRGAARASLAHESRRHRLRHRVRGSAGTARRHRAALDACLATHRSRGRARERSAHFCSTLPATAASRIPIPPSAARRIRQTGSRSAKAAQAADTSAHAADGDCAGGTFYFQRRVGGVPMSALFLADGRRAHDPRFQHAMVGADSAASHFATAARCSPPRLTPRPPTR